MLLCSLQLNVIRSDKINDRTKCGNVLSWEDTDEREDQTASRRVCTRPVYRRTATTEGSYLSELYTLSLVNSLSAAF